jgi:N-acetylmuramoyl-L-alanine amidase
MIKTKVPAIVVLAASLLLNNFSAFSQTPKKLKTIIVDAGHGGQDAGAVADYENSGRSKEKDVTLAISLKLVAELKKQFPDLNIVPTRTTDIFQTPTEKAKIANANKGDLFLCIHADSGPLKTDKRQTGTREETRYKITYTGKGRHKVKHSEPYTVTIPIYQYFKRPLARKGTSVWIFAAHKTGEKSDAIMDGLADNLGETERQDSTAVPFDYNSPMYKNLADIYTKRYFERSDKLANFVNDEIAETGRNSLGVFQRQKGIWVLQATNMPAILVETGFINNDEDEEYLNSAKGQQEIAEAIAKAVRTYKNQIEQGSKITPPPVVKNDIPTPVAISSRPVKETKTIQVKSNQLKIEILDDAEVDGDVVSVYFNKEKIVAAKSLIAKPYVFTVDLIEGKINELVLYAENLGTIPPNTATMVIYDGGTKHELKLSADFKNNASVKFELKK